MENKATIREMKQEEIPQVTGILAKAYATNPVFQVIFPDKATIHHRLQLIFESMFKNGPGRYFVAEINGQLAGGMQIAKSPECQSMSMKIVPQILRAVGGPGAFMRIMKIIGAWKKHDYRQPHWHLETIGITPELQHQGIGKQLLAFYCDLVDKDKMEAYHETDKPENVPFYERFGFKVSDEETVNGVKMWYLLRPAK